MRRGPRHRSRAGVGVGGVLRGVLQPTLHPGSLVGDDVLELAPDVAEDVAEVVALAQILTPAGEALHQVLEARACPGGSGRCSASHAP